MENTYNDPNIEKLYNDLLKLNLKTLTPDETSETWEVVKLLYKNERRRRWKKLLLQLSLILSASLTIGYLFYRSKTKSSENFIAGDI